MIIDYIFFDSTNIEFLEKYLIDNFGDAVLRQNQTEQNFSVLLADSSRYSLYESYNCLKIFVDLKGERNYALADKEEFFNPFQDTNHSSEELISSFDKFFNFCLDFYKINVFIDDHCRPILQV